MVDRISKWLPCLVIGLVLTLEDHSMAQTKPVVVAVLPLKEVNGEARRANLGKGMAARVAGALSSAYPKELAVIERAELEQLLGEQDASLTDMFDPAQAPKIGNVVGVRYLLVGSCWKDGSTILVSLRAVDVATGKIITSWQWRGADHKIDMNRFFEALGEIRAGTIVKARRVLALNGGRRVPKGFTGKVEKVYGQESPSRRLYEVKFDGVKYPVEGIPPLYIQPVEMPPRNVPAVAVVGFSANGKLGEASAWISDSLNCVLARYPFQTRPVERRYLEHIVAEKDLRKSSVLRKEDRRRLGKLLSVRNLVIGDVSDLGEAYLVSCRFVDVETGKILGGASRKLAKAVLRNPESLSITLQGLAHEMMGAKQLYFRMWAGRLGTNESVAKKTYVDVSGIKYEITAMVHWWPKGIYGEVKINGAKVLWLGIGGRPGYENKSVMQEVRVGAVHVKAGINNVNGDWPWFWVKITPRLSQP